MIENGILVSKEVDGVKYGISNYEVARAIGVGSVDVATLCTHPNVNKWAKFKPEQFDSADELTEAEHAKAVNLVGTIVPYGLFKKPAVIADYVCSGATVKPEDEDVVDALTTQRSIEDVAQGMVWEYEGQPKIDYENNKGTLFGEPVYGIQGNFRCRKSDFNGYWHAAPPPIEVEWVKLKASDEGVGGLFVKYKYNDVGVADDYKGLTRADLGLSGYVPVLIGQTVNNELITETGLTSNPRYIIAGHSSTTIDGQTAIGFTDEKLLPLMGDVNFFLVLADKSIVWDIYSESKNGDIYVNPEGWIDDGTYYYPKIQLEDLPTNAYFVEGSAYRANFPDGLGTVIWGTEKYYDYIYSGESIKLYADIEVFKATTVTFGNPYATFKNAVGEQRGFTIKTHFSLMDVVRRAYRRLSFAKAHETQTSYLTDNYINKCGEGTAVFYEGLKPLVRNMLTSAGNYADLYLKFYGDELGCIVYRIKDANGNVLREVDVYTGWGEYVDSYPKLYEEIILENIVSARNQVVGFALRVKMKAGSSDAYYVVYTSTGTNSTTGSSEDTTFAEYPILGALESNNKYWDVEVLLPDDLVPSASRYGGDVIITYDVNKTV